MTGNFKRFVAREILILFGSVIVWGVIVLIIYLRNEYQTSQARSLENKINSYYDIEPFSREKGFEELVKENVRVKYLQEEFDFSDIVDDPREHHISKLHKLLKESNYAFLKNEYAVDFVVFRNTILNELDGHFDHINLKSIYEFLRDKQYLDADFNSFQVSLLASKTSVQKVKLLKEKILSSTELEVIIMWVSIVILTLVYPFRFLVMTLIWAIRTLKTND